MSSLPHSFESQLHRTMPIDTPIALALPPDSARTHALPADARLGRYVVRRLIGEGGMGCVYRAWDATLRRSVAVKVMTPTAGGEGGPRTRFLREARAMAALTHDNVVNVYEVGECGGRVFFAMPHLAGMSLARFLQEKGPPPVGAAVRIAREIASGLAAAHAVGLLHRDVKPGNVFLESPRGRVKLLDFGLATPASGDGRLTRPGLVIGTPAYMAPEQARGLPLDARADLYSLGAVLYHLLTGRPPFDGPNSVAVLAAVVAAGPPPAVGPLNPQVPARLDRFTRRLLSKDPGGRPATADEVVDELRAIEQEVSGRVSNGVALVPRTAPPPPELAPAAVTKRPTRTRRVRVMRRRAGLAVAFVGLGLLGVFGGIGVAVVCLVGPAAAAPAPTGTPRTTSEQEPPPHRNPHPDGRHGPPPPDHGRHGPHGPPPPGGRYGPPPPGHGPGHGRHGPPPDHPPDSHPPR